MHWVRGRFAARLLFWGGLTIAALVVVYMALRSQPLWVDAARVARGPLEVTIVEEGQTRVQDRYVVSTPVAGYMRRVKLEVGDAVQQGHLLTELEPLRSEVLDARSRAEAQARVAASQAAYSAAEQQVVAARADLQLARSELDRQRQLAQSALVSAEALQQAEARVQRTDAALRSANFNVDVARHELAAARTRLSYAGAGGASRSELVPIRSPVQGAVLQLMRESEGAVAAGQPIVEVGDPAALEVVVDVQSFDAVTLQPGMEVRLTGWGGAPLDGRVRNIEPVGFTEISALGVEEQRVRVIVDLISDARQWRALGDGYRVDAHFVLWSSDDVLQVPRSAVFSTAEGEAVFVIEDDTVQLRPVVVGHSDGFLSEVLSGLEEGEQVVRHPGNTLQPGAEVRMRL